MYDLVFHLYNNAFINTVDAFVNDFYTVGRVSYLSRIGSGYMLHGEHVGMRTHVNGCICSHTYNTHNI